MSFWNRQTSSTKYNILQYINSFQLEDKGQRIHIQVMLLEDELHCLLNGRTYNTQLFDYSDSDATNGLENRFQRKTHVDTAIKDEDLIEDLKEMQNWST